MSRVSMVQLLCRRVVVGPLLYLTGRPRVVGREHVPRRGAVILAANHLAFVDSLYVALAARRAVYFLAKDEYFEHRGLRGVLTRWFMTVTGQIPVDRSGGASALPAIDAAIGILERGGAWGIHPEGTRSPDGMMYRGHTGAVRVALRTGAPVVPVAITGTHRADAPWSCRRVTVTVLPPIDLSPFAHDAVGVRRATDELMRVIAEQTGQRRIDEYARRWGREIDAAA